MQQTSRRSLPSSMIPAPAHPGRRTSWRLSSRSAASNESTSSISAGAAPVSNSSSFTLTNSSIDSCDPARVTEPETTPLRRPESTRNSPVKSVDLAAYYTFTKRNSKVVHDESQGLSGFLEYRKLNGTWRPFLFQTIGHQLVLYRVHSSHQALVMSTDIRCASEITLDDGRAKEKDREDTKLLRLGINGTTITLRAVTHKAAMYWVDVSFAEVARVLMAVLKLSNSSTGAATSTRRQTLQIVSDPPCTESEDEIFDEIDKILSLRECTPPPPPPPLCGLCISTSKPEPSTAGTLLKSKKNTQDEGVSSGCKIC